MSQSTWRALIVPRQMTGSSGVCAGAGALKRAANRLLCSAAIVGVNEKMRSDERAPAFASGGREVGG